MRPLSSVSSTRAPSGSATGRAARRGSAPGCPPGRLAGGPAWGGAARNAPGGRLAGACRRRDGRGATGGCGAGRRASRASQRLRRRGPSALLHRRDPAGGAQAARLRARVLSDLTGRAPRRLRSSSASGSVAAHADREVGRTRSRAPARPGSASRAGPPASGTRSPPADRPAGAAPRPAEARGRASRASPLTAIRTAWNTRLAGWPPPKLRRTAAGSAASIASTSSPVV